MILATMLMAGGHLGAQVVQKNEAVVVYYMPKTELVIELAYTIESQTPGIFYQYAKRYLGADDIITESKTQYSLNSIELGTQSSADLSRSYQVVAQKGIQTQLVSLSDDGQLLGYNIGNNPSDTHKEWFVSNTSKTSTESTEVMPLLEEQFMAGTTAKMAEGAAKQIYRIRETRLNILAGEVEHVPADGVAMKLVLDELDKKEQELVELFIGKTTTSSHTYTLCYTPDNKSNITKNEVVCRFSQHTGVVAANDLSGTPVYINMTATKPTLLDAEVVNSKAPLLSQLYYNLPGQAQIEITYNGNKLCAGKYPIAQYGIAIPLPLELFMSKTAPTIHINSTTGNIQSIEQ